MGVIRIKKTEHQQVLLDRRALEDERLSFKARGLYSYLMTKPDDWRINHRHLMGIGPDGRRSILSAFDELGLCGYFSRHRVRDDHGKWGWEQHLYDYPDEDRAYRYRMYILNTRKTYTPSKPKSTKTKTLVVKEEDKRSTRRCSKCGSVIGNGCWCDVPQTGAAR